MEPIRFWKNEVHEGDALEMMADMPESSVHSVVTSPPHYQQKDYGPEKQIGHEDTVEEYVEKLCEVADGVARVIRDDGSFWLSLGDKYDDKDKQMVPYRVAIALQDRGWTIRNDVTWVKKDGGKPQSGHDKLTPQTERFFHLVQQKRGYYYDINPVRVPKKSEPELFPLRDDIYEGKNPGDVIECGTERYADAVFSVFPPKLVKTPILTTVPKKACTECGTPYTRVLDENRKGYQTGRESEYTGNHITGGEEKKFPKTIWRHVGWQSDCDCQATGDDAGVVLDPFCGSGTVLQVARHFNRDYVGLDLNSEHVDLARRDLSLTMEDPTVEPIADSALSW